LESKIPFLTPAKSSNVPFCNCASTACANGVAPKAATLPRMQLFARSTHMLCTSTAAAAGLGTHNHAASSASPPLASIHECYQFQMLAFGKFYNLRVDIIKVSRVCQISCRLSKGFGEFFRQIYPAEQMCQTFQSNPPYTCQSFQVVSPIQVISQTLSLMATALGGTELFLYVLLKHRHLWPSSSNAQVQPESSTVP
jgi:hypothetical protein